MSNPLDKQGRQLLGSRSRSYSDDVMGFDDQGQNSVNSLASSDYSTVTGSTTSLALRRRHVGKNKGSWGQDEYESAEMASFHELAAVIGPEEAASDRLAAQRRAQGTGAIIKQALRLGRDNPVRKATTRVDAAPKPKHVHRLVLETWYRRGDSEFPLRVVADLSRRPVLKSAVVALKVLVTSHKLMQQGAPQVLAGFFGPGLRLLRGIHAGWPKNRAETGPDPPDYALVIRPYADALMLKASFHRQFPEFENNYSVAAGAFEPQTLSALKALQAVQDGLLGCLRMAFNNSGGLRPRDVPKSLRVAILLTVLRETDLVRECICFLAAVINDAGEALDVTLRETFAAQHRALREAYERTRSHAALSLVATPPILPLEPPSLGREADGRRPAPSVHIQPKPLEGADAEEADDDEEDDEEDVEPDDAVLISLDGDDVASAPPASAALLMTPLDAFLNVTASTNALAGSVVVTPGPAFPGAWGNPNPRYVDASPPQQPGESPQSHPLAPTPPEPGPQGAGGPVQQFFQQNPPGQMHHGQQAQQQQAQAQQGGSLRDKPIDDFFAGLGLDSAAIAGVGASGAAGAGVGGQNAMRHHHQQQQQQYQQQQPGRGLPLMMGGGGGGIPTGTPLAAGAAQSIASAMQPSMQPSTYNTPSITPSKMQRIPAFPSNPSAAPTPSVTNPFLPGPTRANAGAEAFWSQSQMAAAGGGGGAQGQAARGGQGQAPEGTPLGAQQGGRQQALSPMRQLQLGTPGPAPPARPAGIGALAPAGAPAAAAGTLPAGWMPGSPRGSRAQPTAAAVAQLMREQTGREPQGAAAAAVAAAQEVPKEWVQFQPAQEQQQEQQQAPPLPPPQQQQQQQAQQQQPLPPQPPQQQLQQQQMQQQQQQQNQQHQQVADAQRVQAPPPEPPQPSPQKRPHVPSPADAVQREWEIPLGELAFGPRIGSGAFGEVVKATWQGTDVAVKRMTALTPQAASDFTREVSVLTKLRHKNIVLFMGAVTTPLELCIVMEYAAHGSLYGVIHGRRHVIDRNTALRWATETARGMSYLHSRSPPIAHRDLKSGNLLVDEDWHIKVSDFGLAQAKLTTHAHTQVGTFAWMAPEVLENQPYDERADVYSFAIVMWELAVKEEPFRGMHPMQIMRVIDKGDRPAVAEGIDAHPEYVKLMQHCWEQKPSNRPSFTQVLARLVNLGATTNPRR